MKNPTNFPPEVEAQVQALIDTCNKHNVRCAVVLHTEGGRRSGSQGFGNKLSCCEFFDSINVLTRVCEKTYGEGTLKQHCLDHPKAHLPQAIGLGREFN